MLGQSIKYLLAQAKGGDVTPNEIDISPFSGNHISAMFQKPEIFAFLYFAGSVLTSLVVTILLCRHRIARRKKSFYLTAVVSAVVTNAFLPIALILVGRIYTEGWHIFTSDAWKGMYSLESLVFDVMLFVVVGTFICIFPMLAIAYYYNRRSQTYETNVASQNE